jgi:hypothetical protein
MSEDVPGQVSAIEVEFDPLNNEDEIKVPMTWMRVDSYQFPDGNKIHFDQITLKLCYAVTAHKAHGQTLSKVAFAHGAFYVGLACQTNVRLDVVRNRSIPGKRSRLPSQ